MIRVKRSSVAKPPVLAGSKSEGKKERAAAETFYAVAANRAKPFPGDFKIYRRDEVKQVLAELFHGKCAYCESRYDIVHPVDVEHFRPKAAVAQHGVLRKPGYYWLAAEWSNLLPSCIDCNRRRRHPALDDDADPALSGKANWFPIANEHLRAQYPGEEGRERRLLLDPCRDRPHSHLIFHKDALVEATSRKGRTSIEVYGLNRLGLVGERREVCLRVDNQMDHATNALGAAQVGPTPANRRALANELRYLLYFARCSQPYAGMVRQRIAPYLELMALKLRAYFAGDVPAGRPARATVDAFLERHATADPAKPVLSRDPLAKLRAI